ncbi:MAG: LapA family protein [Actinomycetota bacterium]|nr:LapA family protein [Actinomycetota bacterium]
MATGVGLLLLFLLLIFILQNPQRVRIHYLWLDGSMPLGVALFGASFVGGAVVAIAGASRIVQLRRSVRRASKRVI